MSTARLAVRLMLLGLHVALGALLCLTVLPRRAGAAMNARQRRVVRWWLAVCARLIGLRIRTVGRAAVAHGCFVANHVSWLDIVVVGSLHHVRFLSKSEIADWPFIGYLARGAGTLFIRRGSGARGAFDEIRRLLQSNESVALFPEGTTSAAYTSASFTRACSAR